jgi:retron-type reverse transcriptase
MSKAQKSYSHETSPLFGIQSKKRMAEVLRCDFSLIKRITAANTDFYKVWPMEKNGKVRMVEEPVKDLRKIHNHIARLLSRIAPPDFLFCPVAGKSSITNAGAHLEEGELRKLDIAKYFPSTSFNRVFEFFLSRMKCNRDVAWHLTALCCYEGHIPTGSPVSPYLSYYAHERMWLEIKNICDQYGYKLTVYMDDMGISAARISEKVIWRIKQEVHKYGLKYHKEKAYKADQPKLLTGAIIQDGILKLQNKHHLKIRKIRMAMRQCSDPKEKQKLSDSLNGLLMYKKQLESHVVR